MEASDESTKILNDLIAFLQSTVDKMISNKLILQGNDSKISSDQLSRKLIKVLQSSLSSEREQYLSKLLTKLFKLTSDHSDLKDEYEKIVRNNRREAHKIRAENEEMERQYEDLQVQLQNYENKKSKKDMDCHMLLQKKQEALENLHLILDKAESTQYVLKKQLSSIKIAISRLQRGQAKMIQEARTMCTQEVKQSLNSIKQNQNSEQTAKSNRLNVAIQKAIDENKQLCKTCDAMLETVWTLTPEGESHPMITSKDFRNRVNEVCDFIDRSVDVKKAKEEKVLKDEIKKLIPDMKFSTHKSIQDTVNTYIQKQISLKEENYQKIIAEGLEKEKRLREKIEKARIKIQKLQSASQGEGFSFDESLIRHTEDWDNQKKKLDKTLSELEKDRCSAIASASKIETLENEIDHMSEEEYSNHSNDQTEVSNIQ